MGQHHFIPLLKLFQFVVDQTAVPARLHHRLTGPFQTGKKLCKPVWRAAFCSSFPQLPPSLSGPGLSGFSAVNGVNRVANWLILG
jgi:hypothetical protein